MPSLSYIKSKLPIITRALMSPNHRHHHRHHHQVPITGSVIAPLIAQKLWSTLSSTTTNLLLTNHSASRLSLISTKSLAHILRSRWMTLKMNNNSSYLWFRHLLNGAKSPYTLSGLALAAAMCMLRIERIPFTDRYHLVLRGPEFTWVPSLLRDKLTDSSLSILSRDRDYKTLASSNIENIRVTNAVAALVKTMHSMFGLQKESIVSTYLSPRNNSKLHRIQNKYIIGSPKHHPPSTTNLVASTSSRKEKLSRWYATKHLEGREWKVAVIKSPEKNVGLLQNSTIFITTGLLFTLSDIELVTAMAHQIGHYIAQHHFDTLWRSAKELLITIPTMILLDHLAPSYRPSRQRWSLFGDFSGSLHGYREEFEADFMGLMLMASMGYDPQITMKFYEKEHYEDKAGMSRGPSMRKRMESLQNYEKMKKAMDAYIQATVNNEVEMKRTSTYKE